MLSFEECDRDRPVQPSNRQGALQIGVENPECQVDPERPVANVRFATRRKTDQNADALMATVA